MTARLMRWDREDQWERMCYGTVCVRGWMVSNTVLQLNQIHFCPTQIHLLCSIWLHSLITIHGERQLQRWNTCLTFDFYDILCILWSMTTHLSVWPCAMAAAIYDLDQKSPVGQRIAWKLLRSKVRDKLWATSIQIHENEGWRGTAARCTPLFEKQGSLALQGEVRRGEREKAFTAQW